MSIRPNSAHGGCDHAHSWDWAGRKLCQDWHVIAPDLRGHGDSAWSPDGAYFMPYFIHDFAQLIDQFSVKSFSIVAHSLGGNIATRYCGIFPERVRRLVNIEGLGSPTMILAGLDGKMPDEIWRNWITQRRNTAARQHRRYTTIDEAFTRMRAENGNLTTEQAWHLTIHGIARNEDGSWSWNFDNYLHSYLPFDLSLPDREYLWVKSPAAFCCCRARRAGGPILPRKAASSIFETRVSSPLKSPGTGHTTTNSRGF